MKELYESLFKRKSVRRFDESLKITEDELNCIKEKIKNLKPLIENIKISYKIVKTEETNCKWNGEYCLFIYSEEKENYLINVGYMFEQLDLYMASINIGACWYGWGKTEEIEFENNKFVIMINFGKCKKEDFRQNLDKVKRKDIKEIWKGLLVLDVANIVKYAPSACNSQPWIVKCKNNQLEIYRTTEITAMLAEKLISVYNKIDIGIFICFLEVTLDYFNYKYTREIVSESLKEKLIPVAIYKLDITKKQEE